MASLRVKNLFFDRKPIIEALGRANAMALSKIGAFIRTRARSSMRKRKRASDPGKPPSVHVGTLKNLLFFSYDLRSKSIVIGPEKFKLGKAPGVLEFGGNERITSHGKPVDAKYEKRPYMGPALTAEIAAGTVASRWSGSVRR